MAGPDMNFWQQRFEHGDTPWDRRATAPQLLTWLDAQALVPAAQRASRCPAAAAATK